MLYHVTYLHVMNYGMPVYVCNGVISQGFLEIIAHFRSEPTMAQSHSLNSSPKQTATFAFVQLKHIFEY